MRFLRVAAIVLAITLGIYLAADIAFAVLYPRFAGQPSYDRTSVPALAQEAYASPAFLKERGEEPGDWLQIPWQQLLSPTEYHGTYFNVDRLPPTGNLYRRTINPPAPSRPVLTVLLLGGSTVYGPESPDGETIASYLSTRLNALDPGHSYVVFNAGVMAADSSQDRDRLSYELARGLKPDIVIACDGQLDILYGIYQGAPGTGPLLNAHSGVRGLIREYLPTHIIRWIRLRANQRAEQQRAKVAPAHLADPAAVERLIGRTAKLYRDNHRTMGDKAAAAGARFISVLAPSPYSSSFDHPTADIAYARDNAEVETPGVGTVEAPGQKALSGALDELRASGRETLDLSGAFQDKTADVYVDVSHLNGTGNRIVAEKIAAAVLRTASSSNP